MDSTIGRLQVEITAMTQGFNREIDGVKGKLNEIGNESNSFNQKLDNLQPTFRKMAAIGTATFAAVGFGIKKAVGIAGDAEQINTNFEITFGKTTRAMEDFVGNFSRKYGLLESDVKQAASGIAFQLANSTDVSAKKQNEMNKQLLLASAALENFFPHINTTSEAANHLSSAIAGNNQGLINMGFSVREADIQNRAYADGIAKQDEELTRSQRTQALTAIIMEQTTGSQKLLNESLDEYTAQQRRASNEMTELTQNLGKAFLPAITSLLQAVGPTIASFSEWAQNNQRLVAVIGIATLAISGLVAVVGLIGIALPAVIAGFKLLGVAITVATGPVGLITAAIAAATAAFVWFFTQTEIGQKIWSSAMNIIKKAAQVASNTIRSVFSSAWSAIRGVWNTAAGFFSGVVGGIANTFSGIPGRVRGFFRDALNRVKNMKWLQLGKDIVRGIADGLSPGAITSKMKDIASGAMDTVKSFLGISSPSKVMRDEVGKMIGAGMADGIDDSTKDAIKSASMSAKGVLGAYSNLSTDLPTPAQLSSKLDVSLDTRMSDIDPASNHVTVKIGEDTIVDRIVKGINNQSFMNNGSVIEV